jgi:hypothetical protein
MKRAVALLFIIAVCCPAAAWAGPVILGGDDLTDHGSRSGAVNLEGWLYIEKALTNLNPNVTRTGPFTTDIAAIGSAAVVGCPPACPGSNAGAAIASAAGNAGLGVTFFDGAAVINGFFASLASGAVNPRIIWLAGSDASNNEDAAEIAAVNANAAALNSYVASGGGLMSHGISSAGVYDWLSTLLPGITTPGICNSTGATLTPAGQAAFPGLTNSNIDANAGPCHNTFGGNFGGLVALALDGTGTPYIIGGGGGTLIQCGQPGQPPCPTTGVPFPSTLGLLLSAGGFGLAVRLWRARRSQHQSALIE